MKIAVLGAGAWGTALALSASPRHDTLLWARDPAQARRMAATRTNADYLPAIELPGALRLTADRDEALAHSRDGLTVIATPMSGLREQLRVLPDSRAVLWLCKGFESGSGGLLGHELARGLRGEAPCGVLSGPSFALEVARGQATVLVAASENAELAQSAAAAFHSDALRVYTSSDIVGVEVGGAVKNVIAIAVGILDGLPAAGQNARAALITRGLAEITRLGVALGAQAETFMGLSGLGDLVLTATGDLSRNRRVGLMLAAGQPLAQAMRELGHVAEGVLSAPTVLARALALGLEMPITEAVVAVLQARIAPAAAMARLMSRHAGAEVTPGPRGPAQTPPA